MSKFATKHDLPANTRDKVIEILQQRLTDALDLQTQVKIAHWNVKGPRFFELHKLFDEVYAKFVEIVDETAERISALGGLTHQTVQNVAKNTTLKPYPTEITAGLHHVESISDALGNFGKKNREAIEFMAQLGDAGSEDMLTGQSRIVDQYLWFVEAHLQDDAVTAADAKAGI